MNLKTLIGLAVLALLTWYAITDPQGVMAVFRSIGDWLSMAAHGISSLWARGTGQSR